MQNQVVIVGAGIVGAAVAYYATQLGVDVMVLERDNLASGASRANGGNVLLMEKQAGTGLELAKESVELHRQLWKDLNVDVGYVVTGGLLLVDAAQDWAAVELHAKQLSDAGVRVDLVAAKELRTIEPSISHDVSGAVEFPDEIKVDPVLLTRALLRSAVENGAELRVGVEATGLVQSHGQLRGIDTNQGSIPTNCAVLAAGVHTARLCKKLDIELPIYPRKGQMIVTQRWVKAPNRTILSAGYLGNKYTTSNEMDEKDITVDFAYSKTKDGNCLIGSTREFAGLSNDVSPSALEHLARTACHFIPGLASVNAIRTYSGLRPFVPDHLPVLGRVDELGGLYVAAGHEGDGITLAPITGKLIADAVSEKGDNKKIQPFSPNRFSVSTTNPKTETGG